MFCIFAELVESLAQSFLSLATFEENGQLDRVEALVAYVTEYVELSIVENRMRQAHHFTVRLVGRENA